MILDIASRPRWGIFGALIVIIFGVLTLYSGGAVLFFDGTARVAAGNYVPFVLWFNFLAGFAYIIAGAGLFLWRIWAIKLSIFIAAATLLTFLAFGLHIMAGGDYETRTIGAMSLRSVIWMIIAYYGWKECNSPLKDRTEI
ncbi:MAG: hypothetical protein L3J50_13795 [Emcibacter sp.]|nr:hypothetical protein [Emcibacter sp.]